MALVEKYHVVAAVRPVATGQSIKEGQIVSLNNAGNVVLQGTNWGSVTTNYKKAYGIAGDTKSTSTSYMPGIASGWQNRASDYFDETKASGKMTVYHSGGEFATDQFSGNLASSACGTWLYCKDGLLDTKDQDAGVTDDKLLVGMLTQQAAHYPSGVPGTDVNGDIALGGETYTTSGTLTTSAETYIEFKLLV